MTVWMTNIEYIFNTYACIHYRPIYGLNTRREQYMVNIILYREHEMQTLIYTITVYIRAARYIA